MLRTVTSRLELSIKGRTNMVFSLAVAQASNLTSESLWFLLDGEAQHATELTDVHGTRLHTFVSGPGTMIVDYTAEIAGSSEPAPVIDRAQGGCRPMDRIPLYHVRNSNDSACAIARYPMIGRSR